MRLYGMVLIMSGEVKLIIFSTFFLLEFKINEFIFNFKLWLLFSVQKNTTAHTSHF